MAEGYCKFHGPYKGSNCETCAKEIVIPEDKKPTIKHTNEPVPDGFTGVISVCMSDMTTGEAHYENGKVIKITKEHAPGVELSWLKASLTKCEEYGHFDTIQKLVGDKQEAIKMLNQMYVDRQHDWIDEGHKLVAMLNQVRKFQGLPELADSSLENLTLQKETQ